ncbi:MAG: hypothetical protein E7324_07435 [Clostridiales bacterium]|nr:hypothetical protein [Clostridiales bacterium]
MIEFPRTTVGGVSLSRMIIGTNWMAGYSHRSPAADAMIRETHADGGNTVAMLKAFLNHGVDVLMGCLSNDEGAKIMESVKVAEEACGRKMILVDTPIINVDDNQKARQEAEAAIKKSREIGSTFCLLHHSSAEQLVNKNKGTMDRLPDYTKMIRDQGMLPGLSAHMPELIIYSDQNGYDVETYIQIYNCMGFLMQVEIETVAKIIHNAKKPVMTIKSMAAGRCTPYVGLNFSWATLRDCDMITVGCLREKEALEDIEISMAALERRYPELASRHSPNTKQAAFGNTK